MADRRASAGKGSLYSTKRWQALRKAVLRRDGYTCQMCGAMLRSGKSDSAPTILRPVAIDHLIPHRGDTTLFHSTANLWAICCDCHDGPCQTIEARQGLMPEMIRAAKIAHRVPSLDGTARRPSARWVDTAYPQARMMIW